MIQKELKKSLYHVIIYINDKEIQFYKEIYFVYYQKF
jgi:hypothetical protein